MKATLSLVIFSGIFFLTILSSCTSPKNKIDTEFERVKSEKIMEDDDIVVSNEKTKNTQVYNTDKNVAKPSEWSMFNKDVQKKIKANENKIQRLKENGALKPKSKRKLTSLEKGNAKIKRQITEYDSELKPNWKNFKKKMDEKLSRIKDDLTKLALADKE